MRDKEKLENTFVNNLFKQFDLHDGDVGCKRTALIVRDIMGCTKNGTSQKTIQENWQWVEKDQGFSGDEIFFPMPKDKFLGIMLRVAVAYNRADLVQQAIDMDADFSSKAGDYTALDYAFKSADYSKAKAPVAAVKVLLDNGVQASKFIGEVTAHTDDIELYEALIEWQKQFDKDTLPKAQDSNFFPFPRKDQNRQKFFILQCEALGYFQARTKSNLGEALLEFFICEKLIESARFLIERLGTKAEPRFAKAYVEAIDVGAKDILKAMVDNGVNFSGHYERNDIRYSALLRTVTKNDVSSFKSLVNAGADYNEKVSYMGDKDVTIEELVSRRKQTEMVAAINKKKLENKNKAADATNSRMDALGSSSSSSTSSTSRTPPTPPATKAPEVPRLLITVGEDSIGILPANGNGQVFPYSFSALERSLTGDVSAVIEGKIPLSQMLMAMAKVAEAQEKNQDLSNTKHS